MNNEARDTADDSGDRQDGVLLTEAGRASSPHLMRASALIGNDVFNAEDDDLGEIKEIMLDMATGQIGYAVLSFGGFLGMGEKLFAVPWAALELDTVSRSFVLRVSKARLDGSPGFDKQHWPDMAEVI